LKAARTLKRISGSVLPADGKKLRSVLASTGDPSVGAGDISAMILRDPGMSIYLLRVMNSAFYTTSGKDIVSMRHLVVLMGMENMARLLKRISVLEDSEGKSAWLLRLLYAKSVLAGDISALVSCMADCSESHEAARLCALGKQFGYMVLWCSAGPGFAAVLDSRNNRIDHSRFRKISGWEPSKLGYQVALQWNLPRLLRLVVAPDQFNLKRLGRRERFLLAASEWINDYLHGGRTGPGTRKQKEKELISRLEDDLGISWSLFSKKIPGVLRGFEERDPELFTVLMGAGIIEMLLL